MVEVVEVLRKIRSFILAPFGLLFGLLMAIATEGHNGRVLGGMSTTYCQPEVEKSRGESTNMQLETSTRTDKGTEYSNAVSMPQPAQTKFRSSRL